MWRDTVSKEQKKKGRERETQTKVSHDTTANAQSATPSEMPLG